MMLSFSPLLYGGLVALVLYSTYELYQRFVKSRFEGKTIAGQLRYDSKSNVKNGDDPFYIKPLPDFDWKTTEPLKFRAFKPKYHLTMAVETSSLSELLEFDKNYLHRITLRKQIIADHHPIAIQSAPSCTPALNELYTFLTSTYLPTRYPTIFTLSPPQAPISLLNHATSNHLPITPPSDPIQTWELIGENLDEDFLILLPSEDGDGYRLMGYVTCFPAGFNTKEKFGMKLREIHVPVPGYKAKLERSMDRFFDRLEVGKVVKRSNWSINTKHQLFAASGTHLYEGEEAVEEEINIDTTFLRCERQLLHRLPKTKALVFNFKTYLYPLREIREEGLGEELALAIDGLQEGSVPEMHFYKRGVVWGEKVKEYLRS
ncbi:uncharacterized protein PAC_00879 [Phialocephala subalpina]|uniref:HRQ family protein 2 n=1 Tax=Phialocephala subalpina TaxID=576137 RepID=A0A1L7WE29_9HELO|nr:uncharacterized protein PAC_00879 [Phialocephala subalpina]